MRSRHLRALLWMSVVAAILVVPVSYRVYLQSKAGDVANPNLGDVQQFVYHDKLGKPWTMVSLRRSVTLILHLPKNCQMENCALAWKQASEMMDWIQSHLTIKYTEEKNPLNLIVTGGNESFSPSGAWSIVSEPIESGTLIPAGFDLAKPWFIAIDPGLSFAGAWSLNDVLNHEKIERVLSRTTFDQYMGNYLARRTFMGPRKK